METIHRLGNTRLIHTQNHTIIPLTTTTTRHLTSALDKQFIKERNMECSRNDFSKQIR